MGRQLSNPCWGLNEACLPVPALLTFGAALPKRRGRKEPLSGDPESLCWVWDNKEGLELGGRKRWRLAGAGSSQASRA